MADGLILEITKNRGMEIRNLEPQLMWKNFADLNEVPRASKKEEQVIAFIKTFGESLNLDTQVDEVGNVLIKKPASPAMESKTKIVIQSHLDMVHQKNADTNFDFSSEGIKMYIDGDWVKAKGTTLGADNGIGVASIMALLESNDIDHPAIEALFTIDEETGMTGAFGLKPGFLEGKILLNLDTEDDDELTIGCAGGVNVNAVKSYTEINTPAEFNSYRLKISGLSGGHSGMDIIKGLGNANKLMNRLLYQLNQNIQLGIHSIKGGGLRNAIPRESVALIAIDANEVKTFDDVCNRFIKNVKNEHELTDPTFDLSIQKVDRQEKMADVRFSNKMIRAVYAVPNGIYRMSPSVEGMVQTSNNLAQLNMANGEFEALCLCRSSVDSEKDDEVRTIRSAFSLIDAQVSTDSDYPGWTPRPSSAIVDLMSQLYREMFNEKPHVMACHAGLECGIIGSNYPDMDMVSFGPNIRGAHSPDEKVQISSVQKYWNFLLKTLKRIPESKA